MYNRCSQNPGVLKHLDSINCPNYAHILTKVQISNLLTSGDSKDAEGCSVKKAITSS